MQVSLQPMRAAMLLMLLALLAGCYGAPKVPAGWVAVGGEPGEPGEPGEQVGQALLDDVRRDERGRLQVFIHYEVVMPSHTAMRLTAPDKPAVMWDPGGGYKVDDPAYHRQADVFLKRTISLAQWWEYREIGCGESFNLVFEWDLADDEAATMYDALLGGMKFRSNFGAFQTTTLGYGCCMAVSDYLQRYVAHRMVVPKRYFWPDNLARQLWTQHPDRVLVLRNGLAPAIYVQSDGDSG